MEQGTSLRIFSRNWSKYLLVLLVLIFSPNKMHSQQVEAEVDTTSIRIGEQIIYKISVDSDSDELVVFPEGQTFGPLEMVESFEVDTTSLQERYRLIKKYALTKFDSGRYTIPGQEVMIDDRRYSTDSLLIDVASVPVDTTKQKMFPIKPAVEVPPALEVPLWIWIILAVIIIGLISYFFFRRRKKRQEEKKLPPFEQALLELEQLDRSHLLEQREIKEYYSQLSAAVRRYLDGEIYDHALESTTGELILYLQAEKKQGHLQLQDQTIEQLRNILERADLAKFANSKPDVLTAKEDRSRVEGVIKDTKASIPQPSEEELLRDEEYRRKSLRKKQLRKTLAIVSVAVILISAGLAFVISKYGLGTFTEQVFGSSSKEVLEGEWIESSYGSPPVTVTTPDVLVRSLVDSTLSSEEKEVFRYGSLEDKLFIEVSTNPARKGFDIKKAVEEIYTYLENKGAKNILTKQEEMQTLGGVAGMRTFGTLALEVSPGEFIEKEYSMLHFAYAGGFQQVVVIYNEGDEFADEIAERIVDSVELNNAEQP